MDFVNHNAEILLRQTASIPYDNRSFRFGDGVFETMRFFNNNLLLADLHFNRLFEGISILKMTQQEQWNKMFFEQQIKTTCAANNLLNARVRLTVYRGNGSLKNALSCNPGFLIESWNEPWFPAHLPQTGLKVQVFKEAIKCCDRFANIKSNNFLPYVMGSIYAEMNDLDDCFILNQYGRISDSTIANVFWIKNGKVFTNKKSEGPVSGVMRRYVIETVLPGAYELEETVADIERISEADEIFLTNAIAGIKWVRKFGDIEYGNKITTDIYSRLISSFNESPFKQAI